MGGLLYMVSKGRELIDVTEFGSSTVMGQDALRGINVVRGDYTDEWQYIDKVINSLRIRITDNKILEPSYKALLVNRGTSKSVTKWNLSYKVMDSFPGYENHCAPTAGTNLMLYWYNRNVYRYGILRQANDQFWRKTFKKLHGLMRTNNNNGTNPNNIKEGLLGYVNSLNAGFWVHSSHKGGENWYTFTSEIDNDYPFVLDYFMETKVDHAMMGIGYKVEGRIKKLQVVNGFSGYGDRYINFDEKCIGMVSFEIQ